MAIMGVTTVNNVQYLMNRQFNVQFTLDAEDNIHIHIVYIILRNLDVFFFFLSSNDT